MMLAALASSRSASWQLRPERLVGLRAGEVQ
jgi:hypothetical protein